MPFLGRAPYEQVLADQLAARERVWSGDSGTIILCEHPPVITLGRSANRANILGAGDVPIIQIERGGDVTYHGPGQLMIYAIVRIKSVVAFLETVAHALAETAAAFGAAGAEFRRDPAGLWLGDGKLAACGIHVARGVPVHGWALNVATPHDAWRMIVPCGLSCAQQVSMIDIAGRDITVAAVAAELEPKLARALL
ncbi:MAG TPA: lipoyl(octanoyl) transferase LipB [Kofleriaceae bacterium]|jgi:lipoyl(octanoyl) transferase|nr:lipoyl(octanoyl) transferase LipB [Kofleriaceae bacterium]